MSTVLNFTVVQKAKKGGGDKYECDKMPGFFIYFPQIISRQGDSLRSKLKITIEPVIGAKPPSLPEETKESDRMDVV
jgi:hypothetical protein